ncbi:MAG: Lrp/AsnC ligand binding domain-containing protein [Nitrosopumilaceae archaeon]|jgi:DNA-binding Lrp family transcriptional regulator
MPEAYVLINCDLGSEESVIEELKHVDTVKEVHGTFGAYDIVAKVTSDKSETLRESITWQIRKINNVRSTLTLMGIEGQN